ncbi:MAG: hypothetical protein A2Y82_03850 [Candidatus Buchananbacteria bacterium RBG_13_36_9]|uniref:Uncharacterized protein n=1 Tax=Candidatus Buchananbacteria bacterium RBG_13_36_9 TaxID=1797530 RepID=A0A1G1XNX4_9BACT|nr:MAG: hypothetical protein A2Y82_03850 [Candidatus Buchananbacteria bacterium RBG_13_36_9]
MAQLKLKTSFEVQNVKVLGLDAMLIDFVQKKEKELKRVFSISFAGGYMFIEGKKEDLIALHKEIKYFINQLTQTIAIKAKDVEFSD